MLNIYGAEQFLRNKPLQNLIKSRVVDDEKLKEQEVLTTAQNSEPVVIDKKIKNYNKRIIRFMREQFLNDSVKLADHDFEVSQQQKLEQAIRCSETTNRRPNTVIESTSRKMKNILDSCRSSTRKIQESVAMKDFKKINFEMHPRNQPNLFESQFSRTQRRVQENSFLDTSPGVNADLTFTRLIRNEHKDRSKDIGPAAFRFSHTAAERLFQAEISPFNSNLHSEGFQKFEQMKKKLFTPETTLWYMPQSVNGTHYVEIEERSKWQKSLPKVIAPNQCHSHLHKKTHFKSTHQFFLQPDLKKVDLEDRQVCEMIKDIQRQVNKRRKSEMKKSFLDMMARKAQSSGSRKEASYLQKLQQSESKDGDKMLKKKLKTNLNQDSEDEDPQVSLADFKKTAKELLQQANVMRRPAVQTPGPNQVDSQYQVFRRIITSQKYK